MDDPLKFAICRLEAFLAEARRIDQCEFPYQHSRTGLKEIVRLFETKLWRLNQFDSKSDPDIVQQECMLSLRSLFEYVPLLGFILRSTNVRNSFEVFGPFLRLARDVLECNRLANQPTTCLILSSEWDHFPKVYREIPALPGFVLIGLPAPESSNPLLIPLAGHELGHSLWGKLDPNRHLTSVAKQHILDVITSRWNDFQQVFASNTQLSQADLTANMFCVQFWGQALPWTLRQAEETFCDLVGIWLFGCGYMEAFAYILSPAIGGQRSVYYPNVLTRVRDLEIAAAKYGVHINSQYASQFADMEDTNLTQSNEFLLEIADESLSRMVDHLIGLVDNELSQSSIGKPCDTEADRILQRFRQVVPAAECARLADILNAAWFAFRDEDLWTDSLSIAANRGEILNELVLKNIELFEIEQIIKGAA